MQIPERNILQRLGHLIGLYLLYLKLYFRTLVEYRADTWVTFFTAGFLSLVYALWRYGLRHYSSAT